MHTVHLRKGREKSVLNRHPWVFESAVAPLSGNISPGELVRVVDSTGAFLAYGTCNPSSAIVLRLYEWDEKTRVDREWLRAKIASSVERRKGFAGADGAVRLVFAESDGLPGLVVDRYGKFLVVQFTTSGAERMKPAVVQILNELCEPAGIYEKTDDDLDRLEGMRKQPCLLSGAMPPEDLAVTENGLKFAVDIAGGQKTGFFLDQRANRGIVAEYAPGRKVLDCFSYTGGFTVACGANGAASLTAVDSSRPALDRLAANCKLNGISGVETFAEDAFEALRRFHAEGRRFGLIVLDPPKLAPTKTYLDKALRAYKDLTMWAFRLLEAGGTLALFSCSGGVSPADLQKAAAWGALDAGRSVQIVRKLSQDSDHPIRLSYPESEYLKGFVMKIL